MARRDDDLVAFVDARSAALLRTARLLAAGDQHAAEDLVQTALEKAYVAWPRIQRKGAREAYVRSILTCRWCGAPWRPSAASGRAPSSTSRS